MLRRRVSSLARTAVVSSLRSLTTVNRHGERIYSPSQDRPSILPDLQRYATLHEWYLEKTSHHHERELYICSTTGKKVNYAEAEKRMEQLARELYHVYHVRAGDVVAIVSPNTADFGSVFHAVLKLGAMVTTVNPLYSAEELRKQLDLSGASVVFTISHFEPLMQSTLAQPSMGTNSPKPFSILYGDRPLVAPQGVPIPSSDQGFLKGKPSDTIVIPFSSGTTGMPKGVQLTNRNIVANILQTHSSFGYRADDVAMAVLPYFHIYGMVCVLHCIMNVGAKQVVIPKFDIVSYLDLIEAHKATLLFVAPPMIVGFVKHPKTQAINRNSVTRIMSGAGPLHKDVQSMCEQLFPNAKCNQGYGLTETSPVTHIAPSGVFGSAGRVVNDTEMRIVSIDADQIDGGAASAGLDAPEGTEGEIWIRGPQVMKGYLKQEDTNQVLVRGGWFRTGDIGRVDPATELLVITDRLKELIKFKGFQVAPAELEGIILTHPLVQDTIVVAVPDPLDGSSELPRAQVVLKPTATPEEIHDAERIISHHVEQHVCYYKQLRGGVRVVDTIPKSATGKLLRRVAKATEIEYLKVHPRFPHAGENQRM